jgi:two-component sensor histidine kinase
VQQFDPETGKFRTYLGGGSIITVHEDKDGIIWAAGLEGLYKYNREKDVFEQFQDPLFLLEGVGIINFVEDKNGNFWMTTSAGILQLDRQKNETTLFGKSYGINANDLVVLSASSGRDGKLYFGYESGYFSFYPNDLAKGIRAPEIIISAFRVADELTLPEQSGILKESISSTTSIRLKHDQNVFSFEFAGIDYSNPEDNRHLFMLENYDANWNLAGTDLKALYFNVPPGKYIFRVKAVNSYGVWSERKIEVIISPPWWTTWWFRIGALLLIGVIFYSLIRWLIRQKFNRQLERSEKDKQLAELRQKTGELEMQALRAQMNPHFLFNSLNAINRFILQNNSRQASEYLTKFSRLVRLILQNSQSTLITLESELDSLKLYLELEALRFDHQFEYKITVPKDMDIEILKVPPLIIQPFAENAIWHGLMHKEEKGHLKVDIRQENEHIFISIKDDGVGRKQSAAMKSMSATKHKSMGLTITEDRISHLQRSATDSSPVVINDLVNPDGSTAGTEVVIKIPVIYD